MSGNRALFLDRDGVINHDFGHVFLKSDFKFIDGIFELASHAIRKGCRIIVITNQGGIGKGLYSEDDFIKLTEWMCDVFSNNGVQISKVYYCASHPAGIEKYRKFDYRRKPNPGMLLEAKHDFNLNLSKCFFVGDQKTDIQAGIAAGVGCNILYDPNTENINLANIKYKKVNRLLDIINCV